MTHWEGEPGYCSESCNGPHYGDNAPDVCPDCGGNGRQCVDGCVFQGRRYETFEGLTGAQEAYGWDYV